MKDLLLTIREMNKDPLQLHAQKLLKQENQEVSESALYLMQVALQIRENPQIREEMRKNLTFKRFNQLMQIAEELTIKHPKLQMAWLMDSHLTDEENSEEILNCKTMEELTYLIADNIVSNQISIEATEMSELDRTTSG